MPDRESASQTPPPRNQFYTAYTCAENDAGRAGLQHGKFTAGENQTAVFVDARFISVLQFAINVGVFVAFGHRHGDVADDDLSGAVNSKQRTRVKKGRIVDRAGAGENLPAFAGFEVLLRLAGKGQSLFRIFTKEKKGSKIREKEKR